MVKISKEIRQ